MSESAQPAPFLRNVLTVLKGSIAAQAVGIAALPVLTRLFAPDAFGTFQLYLSLISFVIVCASLRYEIALLRVESDENAERLVALCLFLNCATALLIAAGLLVWMMTTEVAGTAITTLGVWVPVAALFAGVAQTLSFVALRAKNYPANARARVLQSVGFAAGGVAAGQIIVNALGLMLADMAGRLAFVFALRQGLVLHWRHLIRTLTDGRTRELVVTYSEMPLVAVPAGLVSVAGSVLTPVFMFAAFDLVTAGQYALVERCVMVPIGLVTQSVSQVFMATMAESLRERRSDANSLFRSVVFAHFKLGILPALVLGLAAPWLFIFVFGGQWRLAGEMAQLMSPLFLSAFMASPVNMVLTVLGRQRLQLFWDAGRLAAVIAVWASVIHWQVSPLVAIVLHVCVNVGAHTVFLALAFRACRNPSNS